PLPPRARSQSSIHQRTSRAPLLSSTPAPAQYLVYSRAQNPNVHLRGRVGSGLFDACECLERLSHIVPVDASKVEGEEQARWGRRAFRFLVRKPLGLEARAPQS